MVRKLLDVFLSECHARGFFFWILLIFSWCNEDSENYCAQSVNEHVLQVLWIFSGTYDHVGMVRPHQNGPRRPGHSTFSSQFNMPNIEPKTVSTFPENGTLAVACRDTLVYGLSSGSPTLEGLLEKCKCRKIGASVP